MARGVSKKAGVPAKRPASPLLSRRQSQRIKVSSTEYPSVPSKRRTQYKSSNSDSESALDEDESEYGEDEQHAASSPEPDDTAESEYLSEDQSTPKASKSKKSGKVATKVTSRSGKGGELWREGAKVDLEPGQEVYIQLPKAREAGKTPYQDDTIHPNTLLFLGDLKRNNDREWLKLHDADFRQAQKDFSSFIESLTEKIIESDETIPELPPKDLVFRIYRDVRFSNDPTPYKTHFSAAWSRTGRKGPYAAYYLQIAPGSSFVGGGLWHPEAAPLALLRRDVDTRSHRLKKVLMDAAIRKEFFGRADTVSKVVQAYISHNADGALKRKPKGYEDDNPNLGLLRLKNYTIGKKLRDEEVLGTRGLNRIATMMATLTPFITYLNSVVMPDTSSSSEEEDVSS